MKAVREAKSHTSWLNPNTKYDDALTRFAEAILDRQRAAAFLDDLAPFQARIAHFGALNSLAQTLIKITAPGVPDFYQGTELWDLSLVDPDNRRPVDWKLRQRVLGELEHALATTGDRAALAHDLWLHKDDARVKLFLIREALGLRRAHPALFAAGAYRPLEPRGALAEHVCAFARVADEATAISVAPRLLARRGGEAPPLGMEYWGDTTLDLPAELGRRFTNILTGEALEGDTLPIGRLLGRFPVALLARRPA
jgi:(1->4)-alpha-D-glucan 1-alpha-D-glucosylmutase